MGDGTRRALEDPAWDERKARGVRTLTVILGVIAQALLIQLPARAIPPCHVISGPVARVASQSANDRGCCCRCGDHCTNCNSQCPCCGRRRATARARRERLAPPSLRSSRSPSSACGPLRAVRGDGCLPAVPCTCALRTASSAAIDALLRATSGEACSSAACIRVPAPLGSAAPHEVELAAWAEHAERLFRPPRTALRG